MFADGVSEEDLFRGEDGLRFVILDVIVQITREEVARRKLAREEQHLVKGGSGPVGRPIGVGELPETGLPVPFAAQGHQGRSVEISYNKVGKPAPFGRIGKLCPAVEAEWLTSFLENS